MNKNKEMKPKVTVKEIHDYTPHENAWTEVCLSGNVVELKVLERKPCNNLQHIKRINRNEYYDKRTGEVKQYQKRQKNYTRNLNRSFEKLRQLINTNFTGAINELHIILTYAEEMTNFDKASKDFKRFWEKLHYHYHDLEFICIIEPQHTGSWHIHALLKSSDYGYFTIPHKQIEKLWGYGYVWIGKTVGCDNVGAYFTAMLKNINAFESESKVQTEKTCIVKNGRLQFYPPNKRFYGYSKGIVQPTRFKTSYEKALKFVDETTLVYSSACEINVTYENTEEQVTVNKIGRYQYNSKRKKKE